MHRLRLHMSRIWPTNLDWACFAYDDADHRERRAYGAASGGLNRLQSGFTCRLGGEKGAPRRPAGIRCSPLTT